MTGLIMALIISQNPLDTLGYVEELEEGKYWMMEVENFHTKEQQTLEFSYAFPLDFPVGPYVCKFRAKKPTRIKGDWFGTTDQTAVVSCRLRKRQVFSFSVSHCVWTESELPLALAYVAALNGEMSFSLIGGRKGERQLYLVNIRCK